MSQSTRTHSLQQIEGEIAGFQFNRSPKKPKHVVNISVPPANRSFHEDLRTYQMPGGGDMRDLSPEQLRQLHCTHWNDVQKAARLCLLGYYNWKASLPSQGAA